MQTDHSTSSAQSGPQPGPYAGLLGTTVLLGLVYSFVYPFLSLWGTQHVGLSPIQFSLFMTTMTACAMAWNLGIGHYSDHHFSRRFWLLLGSGAGALGYAGFAVFDQPWLLLLIGMLLVGLASISFSQLFAYVREWSFALTTAGKATRPAHISMSQVRVCFSLAWTVGPAAAALVVAQLGFSGLFWASAGLFLLFHLGIRAVIGVVPREIEGSTQPRVSLWRALAHRDLLIAFVALALNFAAHALNLLNLPLLISGDLGGTTTDLGIALCIGPVVELPLMLWFGRCASRNGRHRLMILGLVATALYFGGLSFARTPWHVFLVQPLSGLSFAILTNVAIVFFQDLRPGQAGLATSVFSNAMNAGNLVGYLAFGFAVELTGNRGLPWVTTGLGLLGLAVFMRMRSTPRT